MSGVPSDLLSVATGEGRAAFSYTSWLPSMPMPGMSLPSMPMPTMSLPSLSIADWIPYSPYASSAAAAQQPGCVAPSSGAEDHGTEMKALSQLCRPEEGGSQAAAEALLDTSGGTRFAAGPQAHSLAADQAASKGLDDEKLPTSTHAREEGPSGIEAGQQAAAERLLDESKGVCKEQEAQQGPKQSDITEAKVQRRLMHLRATSSGSSVQ